MIGVWRGRQEHCQNDNMIIDLFVSEFNKKAPAARPFEDGE